MDERFRNRADVVEAFARRRNLPGDSPPAESKKATAFSSGEKIPANGSLRSLDAFFAELCRFRWT